MTSEDNLQNVIVRIRKGLHTFSAVGTAARVYYYENNPRICMILREQAVGHSDDESQQCFLLDTKYVIKWIDMSREVWNEEAYDQVKVCFKAVEFFCKRQAREVYKKLMFDDSHMAVPDSFPASEIDLYLNDRRHLTEDIERHIAVYGKPKKSRRRKN